jgi:predicted O-methyltransferase YrrM
MHPGWLAGITETVAGPIASSSLPGSLQTGNYRRERVAPSLREPWGKRLATGSARTIRTNSLLFSAINKAFRFLQRAGISVVPNHFYWPVPDLAELEGREWPIYAPPAGCDFRLREQVDLAQEFAERYQREFLWDARPRQDRYHYQNGYFESCDAEVAYSMVRHWKPRRIVEIGSGYSTRIMAAALEANLDQDGVAGELITVDTRPERLPRNGLGDMVTVVPEPVQAMALDLFDSLRADDILFLDSSHVVAVGSDVVREYLEILPRVNPGVLIQVHDIFLPSDYPRDAVLNMLSLWSEQYLLQAFLAFNAEFEVLWSASAMQDRYRHVLEDCFPAWKHSYRNMTESKRRFLPSLDGDRVWPSSFWMRRRPR